MSDTKTTPEEYQFQGDDLHILYQYYKKRYKEDLDGIEAFPYFKEGYRLTRNEIYALREQVKEYRGMLEKWLTLLPGFRRYNQIGLRNEETLKLLSKYTPNEREDEKEPR